MYAKTKKCPFHPLCPALDTFHAPSGHIEMEARDILSHHSGIHNLCTGNERFIFTFNPLTIIFIPLPYSNVIYVEVVRMNH